MDKSDTLHSRKHRLLITISKCLFFYVLVPLILLWFLAKPVSDAVRLSDTAVFLVSLAALGTVGLNWLVYSVYHQKRPPLAVFAHGTLCLLIVVFIEHHALPNDHAYTTTLVTVGVSLTLTCMTLLCIWFASRSSKFAHAASVLIRVLLDMFLCLTAYQIARDFEIRCVTIDTWITIAVMIALVIGLNAPKIMASRRRAASRRRLTGQAEGKIVQIIGETYLDRDGDPVTPYYVRIQYAVDDVPYETRADISRITARRFGRDAFVGRTVPVFYDPADPSSAYVNRIDRHFFDQDKAESSSRDRETDPARS